MLTEIQEQAVKTMLADRYYQRVPAMREDEGEIVARVKAAIAKLGICCVAHILECRAEGSNAPGPLFRPIRLAVDVVELVAINRASSGSQLPASAVAEHTAQLLHYPNNPARGDAYPLACESVAKIPDKTYLIYRVVLGTSGVLPITIGQA